MTAGSLKVPAPSNSTAWPPKRWLTCGAATSVICDAPGEPTLLGGVSGLIEHNR